MANTTKGPSKEDIDWFRSTFHPIPKPKLPDDCVEYSIYVLRPTPSGTSPKPLEVRSRLREVQKASSELIKDLLKDYIWQRESFNLELTSEDGSSLLRGRTEYGDSVEDEWAIVYLLRELTKKFEDIWVKVSDTDGEFLLIEAAGAIPSWLEAEVADNRVWIHKGALIIIKPKHELKARKRETEKITIQDAKRILLDEPKRILHSPSVEAEAFYRLRNYPKQIIENMHSSIVTIPRKIAHLLHQKPAYISPAVEAFYTRDPIALRPLQSKDGSKLIFPPDDLVGVSVRFTRVGYAQLKSQDFPAPSAWSGKVPLKGPDSKEQSSRAETGMKLSCGFEMLLGDPQNQDKASVREMKLVLDDIETGDEKLPTDEEIEKSWSKQEDDEKWLDINFEDLEGELKGKGRGPESKKTGTFGDKSAQENLQRIVAQFEKFLNDDSAGVDGAGLFNEFDSDDGDDDDIDEDDDYSSDGEDREVSFDEEQFSKMMRDMMGMPPGKSPPAAGGKLDRVEEVDSDSDDDLENIQEVSRLMEAELKGTGVLDLNRPSKKNGNIKKTSSGTGKEPAHDNDGNGNSGEEDDIDINLAKNLLESFESQAGSAGPAGNLMGLMGMKLPKDDREST